MATTLPGIPIATQPLQTKRVSRDASTACLCWTTLRAGSANRCRLAARVIKQRRVSRLRQNVYDNGADLLAMTDAKALYLELMKRSLTKGLYREPNLVPIEPRSSLRRLLIKACATRGIQMVRSVPAARYDFEARESGGQWPCPAHTMIGLKRLDNLQICVEDVLRNKIPGDLIETGVWRGGAVIFMRAVLKAYDVTDRCVWAADSFEGFPPGNPAKYKEDVGAEGQLAISIDEVRSHFANYGLLDSQVRFLKGWFSDTLPTAPIKCLAVVRLDGDQYQSTMDGLLNLYPKLSRGGYLIVDDYGAAPACRDAIADFRKAHNISDQIRPIDGTGVYWQRSV
jgi:O-methyltransferase